MPCYDPPPSYDELAEYNFRKYGVRCTYPEMLKDIACQAMTIIESQGLNGSMSQHANNWFALHKADDAKRKADAERAEWNKATKVRP